MHQRCTFLGGRGVVECRNMTAPLLGNLGADKFSETSSPYFQSYFMQIGRGYLYTTI